MATELKVEDISDMPVLILNGIRLLLENYFNLFIVFDLPVFIQLPMLNGIHLLLENYFNLFIALSFNLVGLIFIFFYNPSKLKDIKVQINDDTPILIQLPINKTLNEIRRLLAVEPNIRMGSKMDFMTLDARISQNNECDCFLSKILYDNNLKLIGEQEQDWNESKLKEIKVQINDDTPILIQLPINKTLNEIRRLLAVEPSIRMGSKMDFMSPFSRILQDYECDYFLLKILYDNNLRIIGEQEPDWRYIKEVCKLEYGVNFLKKGPESAKKKAFDITRLHLRKLERPKIIDETVVCKTEIDKICVENLIEKSQVTANLLWSSISATLSRSRKTEKHINIENSITYLSTKRITATISYSESEVKPTEGFIKDVDKALASADPHKNLENVAKEYGPLWCKKLEIGGRILYKESQEKNINEYNNSREKKASGKLKAAGYAEIGGEAARSQQLRQMDSFANEYSFFRMFGGLEESYHESGMSGWINSLDDYQKWEVAEYTEINSIFDILDQERRSKVARKRIIAPTFKYRSYIRDNDDKNTPVIIIHRLGKLKEKSSIIEVKLKLGWIVVRKSTMLNLFGQPVFESDEIEIKANDNDKRLMAVIPNKRKFDPNSSLLATCVSKTDSQDDPRDSKYIAGTHFVYKDGALEACAFCYDLQNMKPCLQFDNIPIKLSVNYSIVAGTGKHQFGQTQITSKSLGTLSLLSQSKRSEVSFNGYLELTEQPTIPSTFSSNELEPSLSSSAQRKLQSPVFVSLILDKCPTHCVHGFFNITPKHAIFKSLNSSSTKDGQKIAYFGVV
ncbi:5764_t:CDS:2 [Ambispora gerdemannii]|uniref:5764_t:CDS:1 n=1 Tax=Ambispora gerdemannii TaxID=144530 RepID=A0A9N9C7C1_9GLOM|nr:5764_t:CDS:2 [Ambispora gerdemannii]